MINLFDVLISLLVVICSLPASEQVLAEDFQRAKLYLPTSYKAEGKILLRYIHNGEAVDLHLAFTEVVDSPTKRSKTAIGYLGYEPNQYFNRDGVIIRVNSKGLCEANKNKDREGQYNLIPELDWFAKLTYANEELALYFSKITHKSGPSILLELLMAPKAIHADFERFETYRNMECKVSTKTYNRKKAKDIKLELYTPPVDMFGENRMPFFSVRESASGIDDGRGGTFDASFTIDYYSVEESTSLSQLQSLEEELIPPLGVGCSEFIEDRVEVDLDGSRSFVMNFNQASKQSTVYLAYDSANGYLRRETLPRGTVSIWDLNEDLSYSIDLHDSTSTIIDQQRSGPIYDPSTQLLTATTQACSVLRVDDQKLGAAQRQHTSDRLLNIVKYLGVESLSYMGRTTVRDMPCSVYETVMSEPPIIFAHNTNSADRGLGQFDYIVQYFLLVSSLTWDQHDKVRKEFWPARITVIKRHLATGALLKSYDSLDVMDFHWGLFGSSRKPVELFMAPECFEVEDEQVRIELLLEFKRNGQMIPFSSDELVQLRKNRYLLEQEILNDLFANVLKVSRLHLTEFQLTIRPHDALVNMVLSDRRDDRKLVYLGKGELPDDKNSNTGTRLQLVEAPDEDTCVSLASHISDISLVAYCPYVSNLRPVSQCLAVLRGSAPVVKLTKGQTTKSEDPFSETSQACYIHEFSEAQPPSSGTNKWFEWRDLLNKHEFTFQLQPSDDEEPSSFDGDEKGAKPVSGPVVSYTARVRSLDLERKMPLQVVDNYRFILPPDISEQQQENNQAGTMVRSFPMMNYDTIGDCARMCNLDVACVSYSYCPRTSKDVPEDMRCLLSSLDLRESKINDQLLRAKLENNIVKIEWAHDGQNDEYNLRLANGCAIHEKDFLDSYSETGEVLTMPANEASKFHQQSSATECAKLALFNEGQNDRVQSHTIAYCPSTQVCLLDSNLFSMLDDTKSQQEDLDENEQKANTDLADQSSCLVYRRKYQTFFHVSPKVFRRTALDEAFQGEPTNGFYQLPLNFSTVEECARACWMQFGHVCASFDYCYSESLCLVNTIALDKPLQMGKDQPGPPSADDIPKEELGRLVESRLGCLHYERDLKIDQMRRSHAIALRHSALDLALAGTSSDGSTIGIGRWTTLLNGLLFCAVSVSFVVGLVLGRRVNDELEKRSLVVPGTNNIANLINSLAGLQRGSNNDNSASDLAAINDHDYNQMSAIQMEEIKSDGGRDAGLDELRTDD